MGIERIEVFCGGSECGDPVVSGGINPVVTRTRRRMNHMGKMNVDGIGKFLLMNAISVGAGANKFVVPGEYHIFECPICSAKKVYHSSASGSVTLIASNP